MPTSSCLRWSAPLTMAAVVILAIALRFPITDAVWRGAVVGWACVLPPLAVVVLTSVRLHRGQFVQLAAVRTMVVAAIMTVTLGPISYGILAIPLVPTLVAAFGVALVNPSRRDVWKVVILSEVMLALGAWFGTRLGHTLWVVLVSGVLMLCVAILLVRMSNGRACDDRGSRHPDGPVG